jgi:hypothetical protein
MIQKFLEHATTEWEALKSAPIAFAILALIAFLVCYVIVRWSYAAKLRVLKGRLAGIDERLAAKDRQLAEYRQRLDVASTEQVSYSGLTNADLKESARGWVHELRGHLAAGEEDARAASFEQFKANAIVLRDELLSRLPSYARDDRWYSCYEHADDAAGMAVVADDLERLAESLSA